MREFTAPLSDASSPSLTLGMPGFTFEDLYRPRGLRRLAERFDAWLTEHEPELFQAFDTYREARGTTYAAAESDLLIRVSRHVSRFLARLFNIDSESGAPGPPPHGRAAPVRLQARLHHPPRLQEGRPGPAHARRVPLAGRPDAPAVAARLPGGAGREDPERALAESILTLMDLERAVLRRPARRETGRAPRPCASAGPPCAPPCCPRPRARRPSAPASSPRATTPRSCSPCAPCSSLADRWTFARALHPEHEGAVPHLAHAPAAQAAGVRPAGAAAPPGPEPAGDRRGPRGAPAPPRRLQAHRPPHARRAR